MSISASPPAPSPLLTAAPVPSWARRVAAATLWASAPSALWRLAVVLGVPLGLAESEYDSMLIPGWGYLVVPLLSVFQEALAFLTLGLVRPWGEVWPRWIPGLRGRRIPVYAAVVPAALGALGCTIYGVLFTWTTLHADMEITRWGEWLMNLCYVPLVAWGPLLAVVTVHYYRRRTQG
ncbi:hypothetical protein GCM10017744_083050 [Streptomyces antimycoticus]|uniref:Uncharacterized protein n=1 Tax=Streptomyces antimycoticus TaxID=68175 RepID=A0A4D4K2V8_9ACTN|nr:hypothetical protein [Streptomyces antimycoticus]BBJ45494.1 hypothetical protein SSPO_082120 [Streptomyces antimycoticus]GDY40948.1 hypothetical protein SANT12839_018300 [Streptomyces antimycoticus]